MRRLATLAVSVMALLGFGAVPSASAMAPVDSPVRGAGPVTLAQQRPFALVSSCANQFSGEVSADYGKGRGGEIRIDRFSFTNCDSGAAVTAHSLPWTLTLDASRVITVRGVEIEVRTSRGTCRFGGDLQQGFFDNSYGLYNLSGVLSRRTSGCGAGETLGVNTGFQELILVNGTGLTL